VRFQPFSIVVLTWLYSFRRSINANEAALCIHVGAFLICTFFLVNTVTYSQWSQVRLKMGEAFIDCTSDHATEYCEKKQVIECGPLFKHDAAHA